MTLEILATCQCGNIKFKSIEKPVIQLCCHCSDCRDATGDDYSELAFFISKSVNFEGKIKSKSYFAESGNKTERDSCSTCGSTMFDKSEGFPGLIGVFIKHIVGPFDKNIKSHVWTKSKIDTVVLPSEITAYKNGLK